MTASSSKSASSTNSFLFEWCFLGVAAYAVGMIAYWAWKIRMQAIEEYGAVIHEFDPWFNYRATEVSYYCSVGEVIFICIRHFKCFAHLYWDVLWAPPFILVCSLRQSFSRITFSQIGP